MSVECPESSHGPQASEAADIEMFPWHSGCFNFLHIASNSDTQPEYCNRRSRSAYRVEPCPNDYESLRRIRFRRRIEHSMVVSAWCRIGHRWIATTQAYLGLAEEEAQARFWPSGPGPQAITQAVTSSAGRADPRLGRSSISHRVEPLSAPPTQARHENSASAVHSTTCVAFYKK